MDQALPQKAKLKTHHLPLGFQKTCAISKEYSMIYTILTVIGTYRYVSCPGRAKTGPTWEVGHRACGTVRGQAVLVRKFGRQPTMWSISRTAKSNFHSNLGMYCDLLGTLSLLWCISSARIYIFEISLPHSSSDDRMFWMFSCVYSLRFQVVDPGITRVLY